MPARAQSQDPSTAATTRSVQRHIEAKPQLLQAGQTVVSPETTIDECMALMTDRRIRHVPVVEGGDVVGIVSIGDVVKFKSKQQSFEIRYLTDYITAG